MSSSSTTEAPTNAAFASNCDVLPGDACKGLPFYKEHEGKRYCVLHYPGEDKVADFKAALKKKLDARDFNFSGVWFPEEIDFSEFRFTTRADFNSATFNRGANFYCAVFCRGVNFLSTTFGAEANFNSARFKTEAGFHSATFKEEANFESARFIARAYFLSATFEKGVDFSSATFKQGANFDSATFNGDASFTHASFRKEANFSSAGFGAMANFIEATFRTGAKFERVTFEGYVRFCGKEGEKKFLGNDSFLNFQFAKIEKPDRLSLHTLTLQPHWFVNVDARKFELINVDWDWRNISVSQQIESVDEGYASAHRLLAIACRNLAVNAEENNRYEEASKFRYMAMDAQRLEHRRGLAFWTLDWWYWLASGYGERILRALVVFLIIWLGFALLYSLPQPVRCPEGRPAANCIGWDTTEKTRGFFDSFSNSAVYAIEAMTLQKPEPRPASPLAHLAVLLCTVLGPVQAALLALAIRRKFMR